MLHWFRPHFPERRPRPATRPSSRFHPRLELLEGRTVPAAPIVVSNLNDAGMGSLRQAVADANTAPGPDIITFQPGLAGTITLLTGQMVVTDAVDIQGPGANLITISGNNAFRMFVINDNKSQQINVAMSGLTLTHGFLSGGGGGAIAVLDEVLILSGMVITGNQILGGGGGIDIENGALATIQNCTISGNSAPAVGGAIIVNNASSLTVRNSTISGNTGFLGGGIFVANGSTLVAENCTISGNSAPGSGGGVAFQGDTATIRNCTIAFNKADSDDNGGGIGGGIFVGLGSVSLQSSIVGHNSVGASGTKPDISGTVTATFSLVENPTGTIFAAGSAATITGADPRLGPLQNNGGVTATHALLAGSPAINAGSNTNALAADQRGPGFLRAAGASVDIGAFEVQSVLPFTDQALHTATQLIQFLQLSGTRLMGAAFGDVNNDSTNDLALVFRRRSGRLLVVTLNGANGQTLAVFTPFPAKLSASARLRLVMLDLIGDAAAEIALLVTNGGPGVPRISVFGGTGVRIL